MEKINHSYNTVSQAIEGMRLRGYTLDFNLKEDRLICNTDMEYHPEDFEITEVHRFEGETNPSDEAIVYGIESKYGTKGVLVNGYGISSESQTDDMIKKLKITR